MQSNIKTSEKNQKIVQNLTRKLGDKTHENVIVRIALGYSLQKGKHFNSDEFDRYDRDGKKYKEHVLFDSKYKNLYIALICQHYGIDKKDENIPKYVKLHIDHGLESLDKIFAQSRCTLFDFLIEHIGKGILPITNLNVSLDYVKNSQQYYKSYFSDFIKIEIGKVLSSDEPVYLTIDDDTKYSNCHIAVAGSSGTGKTQFALDFISQINEKSNGRINYIYLDFKGLDQDDVIKYEQFFNDTRTDFIDVLQKPFPINPLTSIDNINEKNKGD